MRLLETLERPLPPLPPPPLAVLPPPPLPAGRMPVHATDALLWLQWRLVAVLGLESVRGVHAGPPALTHARGRLAERGAGVVRGLLQLHALVPVRASAMAAAGAAAVGALVLWVPMESGCEARACATIMCGTRWAHLAAVACMWEWCGALTREIELLLLVGLAHIPCNVAISSMRRGVRTSNTDGGNCTCLGLVEAPTARRRLGFDDPVNSDWRGRVQQSR